MSLRYNLRTLLIVLALGPPVLAGLFWGWIEFGTLLPVLLIFGLPLLWFILSELGPLFRRLHKD